MFNRLPDRGQDTSRQVGDFQSIQAALGRATGWESMEGSQGRVALNVGNINEETGEIPHFIPGQGYAEPVMRNAEFMQAMANPPMRAREGDMFN